MILFKNNATSRLSQAALAAATTIHIGAGDAIKFPVPTTEDYFFATIVAPDASYEIVKCVNILGDSLIIVRGQQGTTPKDFPVNSLIEVRWTAEQAQEVSNYVPPKATEVIYGTVRKATRQEIENNTGDGVVTTENLKVALEGLSITGAILAFAVETAPDGWLVANGAEVSTLTYDALFKKIGYKYGGSGTTFKLPDLRGLFVRGLGGNAAELGVIQDDAIRNITGSITSNVGANGYSGALYHENYGGNDTRGSTYASAYYKIDASRQVPTAVENRPKNTAMLYCIKY